MESIQGSSLDDYDVLTQISKGAYGDVFLCTHKKNQQRMCMKEVELDCLSQTERAGCLAEVALLRQLVPHPHIVQMYDAFWEIPNQKLILILEFGDAGDLADYISTQKDQRKPVNEKKALEIFIQIILGLASLHQQHILHRDLKSKNVFLFQNGRAVIGDFGTSKVLDNASAFASTLVGSPLYMSPEVLEDKPYSFAADIWALGCILYELLVYVTPFNGPSYPAVVRKITSGKYTPLPDRFVSLETRQLVQKMLELDPQKRPSVHEILAMPLFQEALTQVTTYQPFPIREISSLFSLPSVLDEEDEAPPAYDGSTSNALESTLEASCPFSLLPPPVPIGITGLCLDVEEVGEGNQESNDPQQLSAGNQARKLKVTRTKPITSMRFPTERARLANFQSAQRVQSSRSGPTGAISSSTYVLAPQLEVNLPTPPPAPPATKVQTSSILSIHGSQVPTPPKSMITLNHRLEMQQQLFKQKKQQQQQQSGQNQTQTKQPESTNPMMIIGVKIKDPITKYPTNSLVFH